MAGALHISIRPETLFSVGSVGIYNTLFTSFLSTVTIIAFLYYASRKFQQTNTPDRFQAFFELLVEQLYSLVESVAGKGKRALEFAPLISGFLIFIALTNWVALLPGVHTIKYTGEANVQFTDVPFVSNAKEAHAATDTVNYDEVETLEPLETDEEAAYQAQMDSSKSEASGDKKHSAVDVLRGPNADLNMTLALALISVGATQYFGVAHLGLGYFKKFFNFSSPIQFFIGLLELVAEFSKIISFAFRLFGNIFAGEVLISVMKFLVPVLIPLPFMGFEIFIGALQAYVFAMLTLVFFTLATEEHH